MGEYTAKPHLPDLGSEPKLTPTVRFLTCPQSLVDKFFCEPANKNAKSFKLWTAYTEIRNVYNRKNTIRFHLAGGLADRLEAELETLEFEEDTELLAEVLGFELNEYLEIRQSRFSFSIGFLYEF